MKHLTQWFRFIMLSILLLSIPGRKASAEDLTGCIVNEKQEPIPGSVVSLVNAARVDTAEQGCFRFSGLSFDQHHPTGGHLPAKGGEGIIIDVFTMTGKRIGHTENVKPAGRFNLVFPSITVSGVYIVSAKRGGLTVRYKFYLTGREMFAPVMAPIIEQSRIPSGQAHAGAAVDTLVINSPGMPEKRVCITGYTGDLGKIAVGLAAFTDVVFAVRTHMGDAHWYANIGYSCNNANAKRYGSQGRLCKLNLSSKVVTKLVDDVSGSVRDPHVSYDGKKILFSYRKGGSEYYNLYEINVDGTGLRQITTGNFDDIEPTYLPDGGIIFVSTRGKRWVNCWFTQVAILYRCDGDGKNMRQLSANIEQDNCPWMLPDGMLVYLRWEYVDRSQVHYHHLWKMMPDGREQMVLFGNYNPNNVFLDAKPIPGTNPLKLIMIHAYDHGYFEHIGDVATVTLGQGPDVASAEKLLTNKGWYYRDPYPLSPDSFLVVSDKELLLMRGNGTTTQLYTLSSDLAANGTLIHEPRPIMARAKEPALAPQVNLYDSTGTLLLLDITIGRKVYGINSMAGVNPGDIKKLLILETLPKPVNFTGGMDPMSFGGTFTMDRVIGTVPVESDGSAYMKLPANRSFFFVALDSNNNSVKRMQSFLSVVPGERGSCIGCHEDRTMATPNLPPRIAAGKPPAVPEAIAGIPQVFDYPRDIQPIWNKYCISCHNADQLAGGVNMTGDDGPIFSLSYYDLSSRMQIADGRNLALSEYPPRKIGSTASPLMKKIDGSHNSVVLTAQEKLKVKLWIEASAHYPGTYAALGTGMLGGYIENTIQHQDGSWASMTAAKSAMDRKCASCHTGGRKLPGSCTDDLALGTGYSLVFNGVGAQKYTPPWWLNAYGTTAPADYGVNIGTTAWMKKYGEERLLYMPLRLYNLTQPEKSLMLMAPLAKSAGGHGKCGNVFTSTSDADYQAILTYIKEAKTYLGNIKRFSMANFKPKQEWVREMIKYEILPPGTVPSSAIDVYATEEKYWQSLWWEPIPGGTGIINPHTGGR